MTATSQPVTIVAAPHQKQSRRNGVLTLVVAAIIVAAVALLVGTFSRDSSQISYAPNNSYPQGSMALANILEDQGVEVEFVTTTAHALNAVEPHSTLLITRGGKLAHHQLAALADLTNDVVMIGTYLEELAPWPSGGAATRQPVDPQCDLPAAVAAGTLDIGGRTVDAAQGCYLTEEGALLASTNMGVYLATYFADTQIITNEYLAQHGNAALALHLLGNSDHLVWYVPSTNDQFLTDDPTALPPIFNGIIYFAVAMCAVAWLWRGRRLGPVVVEELPVQVPAAQTTRGLGNLYHAAHDQGHAAQILRAHTLHQIGRRVGLTPGASPAVVVNALSKRSGWPAQRLDQLLYGPLPTTDEELVTLSNELATLEKEV